MLTPVQRAELVAICGEDSVFDDATHRRLYDSDAYTFVGIQPDAVVLPREQEIVRELVRWCLRRSVPYVARGAGTGLSGGCLSAAGGIQIGTARLNRILELDAFERWARVEPGVVNLQLDRAASKHGLGFAPDPSSQGACTVGGNFAENSGGPHTLKLGVTLPHILGARIVGDDGEFLQLGGTHRPAPEVDLLALSVGAEGTCGIATELTVRLVPIASAVETLLAVFDRIEDAAAAVSAMIAEGVVPAAMELIDQLMIRAVEEAFAFGFPLDADAVLLVEIDGDERSVQHDAPHARSILEARGAREIRHARDPEERALLWKARKHSFGAIGRMAPNYATQDGVVPRAFVPDIVRKIRETSRASGIRIGTVIHAGDGNIHPCVLFDGRDEAEVERALAASYEILEECIRLEGSPTGEHGVGLEKRDFLPRLFGPDDLKAMAEIRLAFDPHRLSNPDKVLPGSGGCGELRLERRQVPL